MIHFNPCFEILPESQKNIWQELAEIPEHFILYGGTAIALRLGHRTSVDFDFFSSHDVDMEELLHNINFLKGSQILQQDKNTLTALVQKDEYESVKISFFGGLQIGRLEQPEVTKDKIIRIASQDDLLAHKLKVLLQRVDVKDYKDIASMLISGMSLAKGLAGAKALWEIYPVMDGLKSLTFFHGKELEKLSEEEKHVLLDSANRVDPSNLPFIELDDQELSGSSNFSPRH